MVKSLLDEIATRMARPILYDLKGDLGTPAFDSCVKEIPNGIYPLDEWKECVKYLIPQAKEPATEEEARHCLTAPIKPFHKWF